ncbi:protein kinase [uncultured Paludibaculum sp.]|uniref:serine/threonine-protein kinase n=1 Tax=uncultured Paludibaculum sp. TaxID=1765020 RepID=UPI002AAB79A2|nr:protein kinase [uncultured Paludibaculum sp.]
MLFDIIEAPVSERELRLHSIRQASPETAVELERLLQCHDAAGEFLLRPADLPDDELPQRVLSSGLLLAERFLIEQFLGAGGFGEVYLALDQDLGRRVAIKTIRPSSMARPDFIDRSKEEIRAARAVAHRNLCRLYDLHRATLNGAEIIFLSMEWICGPTLAEYLRERVPTESEAYGMAEQLLAGVAELHSRGVIHCDLKSSNVMLDPEPDGGHRVVVTDFGMARMKPLGGQDTLTVLQSGWAAGTPAYMAPEQLRGAKGSVASDLHAVGVILFELRTRRVPFEGDSPLDIAMARLEHDAPSVRRFDRTVSKPWDRAIAACLERKPEDRPGSALEVMALLNGERRALSRRWFVAGAAAAVGVPAGYLVWSRLEQGDGLSLAARRSMQLGAMFLRDRNRQSFESAVQEYSSVTRAFPDYAPAWAGLADAYSSLNGFGFADTREMLRKATEAGRRAVELDPRNGRVLGVYARNLSMNVRHWLEAEPYFVKAMRLSPDDPRLTAWYAAHLGRLARYREALELLQRGLDAHPDDLALNYQLATEYLRAGRLGDFEAASRELVRLFFDKPLCRLTLARALEFSGKLDEAEGEIQEAERLGAGGAAVQLRVTLAAARGRMELARRLAVQVGQKWDRGEVEAVQFAVVCLVTGQDHKAIEILNEGFNREDSSVLYAPTYIYFARLRHTEEFVRFARRLGLPG